MAGDDVDPLGSVGSVDPVGTWPFGYAEATLLTKEVSAPHGGIKWLEYRFGIACSECRAYMPSVWRHGSVVNSESRWKRFVAATVSIKFSWMAKPSSTAASGSLLV